MKQSPEQIPLILILILMLGIGRHAFAFDEDATPAARNALRMEARTALEAKDFAKLEARIEALRISRARDPSGSWSLTSFYWGLSQAAEAGTEADWQRYMDLVAEWQRAKPASVPARVTEAALWENAAWRARGRKAAKDVDSASWDVVRDRVAKAESALDVVRDAGPACPEWYGQRLHLTWLAQWPRDKVEAVFGEAVAKEPLYYDDYFAKAVYLHPRWFGSVKDLAEFAKESVERTRAADGESIYARVYWALGGLMGMGSHMIYSQGGAEWPRIKKGFEDMLARYPSEWNRQAFAAYACGARDAATTRSLTKAITTPLGPMWATGMFDQCLAWSSGDGAEPTADVRK